MILNQMKEEIDINHETFIKFVITVADWRRFEGLGFVCSE